MLKSADEIAEKVVQALIDEVETTPKPGLVDLISNGSHTDLSVPLFYESACTLQQFFREFALLGSSWKGNISAMFPDVRTLGQEAERAMLLATGGVNTHKGALFSLGILSAVTGFASTHHYEINPSNLCLLTQRMTRFTLECELAALRHKKATTHGELLFAKYGCRGIRGEVMQGFPSVRHYAIPAIKKNSPNNKLLALVSLMTTTNDSNVLHRGGRDALLGVKATARNLLLNPIDLVPKLERLDETFVKANISSGGCADLLAVTYYLTSI